VRNFFHQIPIQLLDPIVLNMIIMNHHLHVQLNVIDMIQAEGNRDILQDMKIKIKCFNDRYLHYNNISLYDQV